MLQRVTVKAFGGPERLILETAAEALAPGAGQVLVDVEAAGINYLDVHQRKGIAPVSLPFRPGLEGVGRISAVGEDVDRLAAGDRVAWINASGSYASQVLVPAAEAIPVPDSFTTAQSLLFQAITASILQANTAVCVRVTVCLYTRRQAVSGRSSSNGSSISAPGSRARHRAMPKLKPFAPPVRTR